MLNNTAVQGRLVRDPELKQTDRRNRRLQIYRGLVGKVQGDGNKPVS